MRDKTNPNGFYKVAEKRFEIKVGRKDHEALDNAIEYAMETWNDVYQGEFANLVWVNPMNPNQPRLATPRERRHLCATYSGHSED